MSFCLEMIASTRQNNLVRIERRIDSNNIIGTKYYNKNQYKSVPTPRIPTQRHPTKIDQFFPLRPTESLETSSVSHSKKNRCRSSAQSLTAQHGQLQCHNSLVTMGQSDNIHEHHCRYHHSSTRESRVELSEVWLFEDFLSPQKLDTTL